MNSEKRKWDICWTSLEESINSSFVGVSLLCSYSRRWWPQALVSELWFVYFKRNQPNTSERAICSHQRFQERILMLKKSLKSRTIYCFTFQKENKSKELSSFLITQEYNHLITLLYIQICLRKKKFHLSLIPCHKFTLGRLESWRGMSWHAQRLQVCCIYTSCLVHIFYLSPLTHSNPQSNWSSVSYASQRK